MTSTRRSGGYYRGTDIYGIVVISSLGDGNRLVRCQKGHEFIRTVGGLSNAKFRGRPPRCQECNPTTRVKGRFVP